MHAQSVHIHVWLSAQKFHALHLVLHFHLSELAISGKPELTATAVAATVVENEQHIATLRHVCFPTAAAPVPTSVHIAGMWATIHIHHSRVFFRCVEVGWKHHAIVEVGGAVGCLDSAILIGRHGVANPRVGGGEEAHSLAIGGVQNVDIARHVGLLIPIHGEGSVFAQQARVHALAVGIDASALARSNIHTENVVLQIVCLGALNHHGTALGVESHELGHFPVAAGELLKKIALHII